MRQWNVDFVYFLTNYRSEYTEDTELDWKSGINHVDTAILSYPSFAI